MTSIITAGCSFTEDSHSWANVLQNKLSKNYNVYNCAMGGVGQEYIVRSAMMKLHETKGPKICIAQFSGFSRIEINIEKQENPLHLKSSSISFSDITTEELVKKNSFIFSIK